MSFNLGQLNDKKRLNGISRDLLVNLYWFESMSSGEIARKFNTSGVTVRRWLEYYRVPKRAFRNFQEIEHEVGEIPHTLRFNPEDKPLTQVQKEVLIGTLCGDGCLRLNQKDSNRAYFAANHGLKQYGYAKHKAEVMAPQTSRLYVSSKAVEMATVSSLELALLYRQFYSNNGSKFLDRGIFESFTETSLVYWYLDDGALSQGHYQIWAHKDMIYDWANLASLFSKKFSLPFTVQESLTNNMRALYIPRKGMGRFTSLLLGKVPDCLGYKIHPWYAQALKDNQQPSLSRKASEGSTTTSKPTATNFSHGDNRRPLQGNLNGMPSSSIKEDEDIVCSVG